jgi:cation:H+ antiporter
MAVDVAVFLLCSGIIFFSGRKLSYYGGIIADKSGLGNIWIGLLLMATVTSLPELVTGISSVRLVGAADLAVGNVLGSCAFNLALLSLLDALLPKEPLLARVAQTQVLGATLCIILLGLVGIGLFLPENIVLLGWIGGMSVFFIIVYLASIKLLHVFARRERLLSAFATALKPAEGGQQLRSAVGWYALHAVIVIAASLVLPFIAERIVIQSGLSESFVSTLLLAAATSLPEIAVSMSAIRMGHVDIAVGNLFGSNIFNIFTLAIDDLFYTPGELLKDASELHIVSVFSTIIMTAIAIAGLTFRVQKKRFFLAVDTFLIFALFLANLAILYFIF